MDERELLIFPLLRTERLILRQLKGEDFAELVKLANNKEVSDQIINMPHPYQEPDAAFRLSYIVKGFKEHSRFVFAIISKELDTLIGEISLHLEKNGLAQLGYWIGKPHWNKGYATEAIQSVLLFGKKTLMLDKIYASCHPENHGSIRVLEKNNFSTESTQRGIVYMSLNTNEI